MKRFVGQERFSDFKIPVGEGERQTIYPAHKAILNARSPFFRSLFEQTELGIPEKEREKEEERAKGIGREVTEFLLDEKWREALPVVMKWIYTDTFDPTKYMRTELWEKIKELARTFRLERLQAICEACSVKYKEGTFESIYKVRVYLIILASST